ncbi:MAG TPA: amidohydrolase family protein [Xanthobacteraceae bacterium]|nr:amidohydrolase family protein [Xanthobacteraceae bacterium]
MQPGIVLRNCRILGEEDRLVDIALADGRIAEISSTIATDGPVEDVDGRLVFPGFVETHIHLDKSCILDRCKANASLAEAIAGVSALKRDFTEADVYARARGTLEKSILNGITRMRTHVEVDPRIGLRGFAALEQLKRDYAWALDVELCVFPQDGLLNDPGTEELLIEACRRGADVIGGCPYTDSDPHGQIARIFTLAHEFDLDIDFHLDFDLDPSWMHLDEVCRQTDTHGYGGRVTIGHVTKLSAVGRDELAPIARRLADCGVAVTVLPSTDLFLMGGNHDHDVPRGVAPAHRLLAHGITCSLATNNVLNPFTPFGDCSLIRMANLYANIAQLGTTAGLAACFDMITTQAARLTNAPGYGLRKGGRADLVVLDARDKAAAVAELRAPVTGFKAGRRTFTRPLPVLHRPAP